MPKLNGMFQPVCRPATVKVSIKAFAVYCGSFYNKYTKQKQSLGHASKIVACNIGLYSEKVSGYVTRDGAEVSG
jgi:hypothetical protein